MIFNGIKWHSVSSLNDALILFEPRETGHHYIYWLDTPEILAELEFIFFLNVKYEELEHTSVRCTFPKIKMAKCFLHPKHHLFLF